MFNKRTSSPLCKLEKGKKVPLPWGGRALYGVHDWVLASSIHSAVHVEGGGPSGPIVQKKIPVFFVCVYVTMCLHTQHFCFKIMCWRI